MNVDKLLSEAARREEGERRLVFLIRCAEDTRAAIERHILALRDWQARSDVAPLTEWADSDDEEFVYRCLHSAEFDIKNATLRVLGSRDRAFRKAGGS